jgi:hypothetical protein
MRGESGQRPGEGSLIGSDIRELEVSSNKTGGLGGPRSKQLLESLLHAVERVPSEGRGKLAQFVPIRFVFRNKLTKDDRLLLAFDSASNSFCGPIQSEVIETRWNASLPSSKTGSGSCAALIPRSLADYNGPGGGSGIRSVRR